MKKNKKYIFIVFCFLLIISLFKITYYDGIYSGKFVATIGVGECDSQHATACYVVDYGGSTGGSTGGSSGGSSSKCPDGEHWVSFGNGEGMCAGDSDDDENLVLTNYCYRSSDGTVRWTSGYSSSNIWIIDGNYIKPKANDPNIYQYEKTNGYTVYNYMKHPTQYECKMLAPACYKDTSGTYVWDSIFSTKRLEVVQYGSWNIIYYDVDVMDSSKSSYQLLPEITSQAECINPYACYRKKISNEEYEYKWISQNNASGYQKVDGITNETDCILENPSIPNACISSSIISPKTSNASVCSENTTLSLDDEKVCSSSITSQFYTINCRETITSSFKPGNLSVKAGQGFKYNIDLLSSSVCEGSFNATEWNAAYNNAVKAKERAQKTNDASEIAWYQAVINQLNDIVSTYNSIKSNYLTGNINSSLNNVVGKLNLNYKYSNGKSKSREYEFFKSTPINRTNGAAESNSQQLASNVYISDFSVTINSTMNLTPPVVYLDKNGNEVAASGNAINGGNQFLTDLLADKSETPYSMSITLSNLGVNGNGTITNNQCGLTITDGSNDITYRIIDVGNPFGIDSVNPGSNWSNTNFNFRETIDKNTWSGEYLYKFDLTSQDIKNIKEDNSKWSGLSAYRGVCNENETILSREFKEKVCDELNK